MTLKDEYYSEEEVTEFLGIAISTIRFQRSVGRNHPPYVKIGKKTLYPKKDFDAWVKSHKTQKAIAG